MFTVQKARGTLQTMSKIFGLKRYAYHGAAFNGKNNCHCKTYEAGTAPPTDTMMPGFEFN